MGFLEILVQKNIITASDMKRLERDAESKGTPVETLLAKKGIEEDVVLSAKSEYFGIPTHHVDPKAISDATLSFIPGDSARHYRFVPVALEDGELVIGITNPDNLDTRDALNFITSKNNQPYKLILLSDDNLEEILERYRGLEGEVEKVLSEFETESGVKKKKGNIDLSDLDDQKVELLDEDDDVTALTADDSTRIVKDAPVTKIVATILRYAVEGDASDVHIEHTAEGVRVRFRVDGILNTSLRLPKKIESAVVARIKILSNMRLDEKRKPQDGRFSARIEGRKIDFRTSTFPTYYGEKVVMRILDQEKGVRKIDDLGLTPRNLELIKEAIALPYGIILISGPTGSGKSTTLYSILSELDSERQNILSLEDPIEYSIDGVSQSQVRPDIGYTFANGLRTTLRQDPNIIMVGEIRDKETAQLAIQAALTGHLVLSTIHTNNAVGVISRLINMGVDPYLIAPTLRLAIAQRLVRKLIPGGGKAIPFEGGLKTLAEKSFEDLPEKYRSDVVYPKEVMEPAPTKDSASGLHGRAAVMEVLKITKEIEQIILDDPKDTNIYKVAREQGMLTMKEDAILKAFNKEIPYEEVSTL